jgi:alkaline phosphatase
VTALARRTTLTVTASLTLALFAPAFARAQAPPTAAADASDRLKLFQTANVATAKAKRDRVYHFGSQGAKDVFSNHTSHSNRLIPVYAFGRKADLGAVTGGNSVYRDAKRLEALYGFPPENTVNPDAEYADQSDLAKVQLDAVARGAKHLFIIWFDGMDWPTTQAAAVAKSGKVYTQGKGSGLSFQDYDAGGSAQFGFYVTAPTHDGAKLDVDAQTVTVPPGSFRGGYDARFAGPNPWTPGPLDARAPGYIKGDAGDAREQAAVRAAGGSIHTYTDSAPSAAEFASGRKQYNTSINVTERGEFVPTVFHRLQARGWKVGTATSVPFNHASPAAMYAHNVHRDDYQDLAREMLGLTSVAQQKGREPAHPGLDVVIGTGFSQSAAARGLTAQGKNAVPGGLYVTAADLAAVDVKNGGKYVVAQTERGRDGARVLASAAAEAARGGHRLFGLFGSDKLNHLPYRTADGRYDPAPDLSGKAERYTDADLLEQPTLADMTRAALAVLGRDPEGRFALFVEAGDVDFALHANNLDNAVGAVYSGDDAVKTVIAWVERYSNWDDSVLIVTADHGHYLVIDDIQAITGSR